MTTISNNNKFQSAKAKELRFFINHPAYQNSWDDLRKELAEVNARDMRVESLVKSGDFGAIANSPEVFAFYAEKAENLCYESSGYVSAFDMIAESSTIASFRSDAISYCNENCNNGYQSDYTHFGTALLAEAGALVEKVCMLAVADMLGRKYATALGRVLKDTYYPTTGLRQIVDAAKAVLPQRSDRAKVINRLRKVQKVAYSNLFE